MVTATQEGQLTVKC